MRWVIEPAPGFSEFDLIEHRPNQINARLVGYKNGVPVISMQYDDYIASIINPDSSIVRVELRTPTKRATSVEEVIPRHWLYSGSSPFRQLIIEYLINMERQKKLVGINELSHEIAKQVKENPKSIKKLIHKMAESGQVFFKGGHVFVVRHPALMPKRRSREMEFTPGINPIMKRIWDIINARGLADFDTIRAKMLSIRWIIHENTLRKYIKRMIKKGYIAEVGTDMYEIVKPIGGYE